MDNTIYRSPIPNAVQRCCDIVNKLKEIKNKLSDEEILVLFEMFRQMDRSNLEMVLFDLLKNARSESMPIGCRR
jgi:hypothetical protein